MSFFATPTLRGADAPHRILQGALIVVGVALMYALAARVCDVALANRGLLTPVWLPSGVAIVAVAHWRRPAAAGVFVGDIAASVIKGLALPLGVGLALGDTLEPIIALLVLARLIQAARQVTVPAIGASVAAAAAGSTISATSGAALLHWLGPASNTTVVETFGTYWASTFCGMLLIGYVVLTWWIPPDVQPNPDRHKRRLRRRAGETVLLLMLVAVASGETFLGGRWGTVGMLCLFLPVTWAAVRCGIRATTSAVAVIGIVGMVGIARGATHVPSLDEQASALVFQVLMVVVLIVAVVVATISDDRDATMHRAAEMMAISSHAQHVAGVGSWQLALDRHVSPHAHRSAGWCSDELATMLGLTAGDDRARVFDHLLGRVPDDERAHVATQLQHAIAAGSDYRLQHHLVHGDGTRRTVSHVGVVRDDNAGNAKLLAAVLDITRQCESDALKDLLIATASHELRTPLTSILGFSQTLDTLWDRLDTEQRRRFLMIIHDQALRMSMIVDDTLEQSRIDSGSLDMTLEPVELAPRIKAALERLGGRFPDAARVEVTVPDRIVVAARADSLDRILGNVLANALAYGALPIRVSLDSQADSTGESVDACGTVTLLITDYGTGIDDAFVPRLFDRFTRGLAVNDIPGSGLGLSVAQGLIEAMQGTISHERVDNATTFRIVLRDAESVSLVSTR